MKRYLYPAALLGLCLSAILPAAAEPVVEIKTTAGTMKIRLCDDTPRHARAFAERVRQGLFDGTLFTRVIPGFMIQGGAPDSRTAAPGARTGFGDPRAEIMPEISAAHIHRKGALAAPRQDTGVNPQKKSDMSQFFIVQGRVYTHGQLDTLEMAANRDIRRRAMAAFYHPVKAEMDSLLDVDRQAYNRHVTAINAKVDSMIRATPGHLIFTPEQREAYTTAGGSPHLDGEYTIYGEMTEGFDVLDAIAARPRDAYDRPKTDIRIVSIRIQE
ncbi:MAG: peptidylprolyl isomerase [Tannerella sp.]|nr:peptidylprolyl isomerase [Tannerella sp.]